MSSSDRSREFSERHATAVGTDAYAAWLRAMQRTRGRHAAITKNLYTGLATIMGRQGEWFVGRRAGPAPTKK